MAEELTETPQNTEQSTLSVISDLKLNTVQNQLQSIASFQNVVKETLEKDHDYGVIPKTNKPTLLKPGAEKILMILGLSSEYSVIDKVENYDDGFFAYTVEATLLKNGQLITQGIGSANTRENRYRQYEYVNDKRTEWKGEYQDAYTLQNTVLKMAKKRAQVDATLTVASLSNVFTQDMEDNAGINTNSGTSTKTKNGSGAQTVITFGKYKGQTLEEIYKRDVDYIKWLSKEARDLEVRKSASTLLEPKKSAVAPTHTVPSSQLINETEALATELATKEKITEAEVLKNNRVTNIKSLTPEQCKRLKQKLSKDLETTTNKSAEQPKNKAEQPAKDITLDIHDDMLPF